MTASDSRGHTSTPADLRVLLSAYACAADRGSEPGVGWQALQAALAVGQRVWVLTRAKHARLLRDSLDEDQRERVTVVPLEAGAFFLWLKRVTHVDQLYYVAWQWHARRVAVKLHARESFDVAHHATFASDWLPCGVAGVDGLPLVLGPVGGSLSTPRRLRTYLGLRGRAHDAIRRVLVPLAWRCYGREAAAKATVVFLQNEDLVTRYRSFSAAVEVVPNTAIETEIRREPAVDSNTLVGAGRLIGWKGWALALHALSRADPSIRLRLYGNGTDRARLKRLAAKLNVEDRVEFAGVVSRDDLLRDVARARAFVSMSFHEAAGWSVAEALSIGTPVLALDLGGPATLLRASGQSPIPHTSPNLVEEIARQMEHPPHTTAANQWSAPVFRQRIGRALVMAGHSRSL